MTVLRPPVAPIRIGSPPRTRPAPVWIRAFAAGVTVAAAAVAVVLASAASSMHEGLTVLGHRTAPQVATTEDLYRVLSDMDTQLANVLLVGDDPSLAQVRDTALRTFEVDRTQASADLQQAATVAGDDAQAQRTVRTALLQFGRYQSLAAQTIQLNDREGNDAGRASRSVVTLQNQASGSMRATLDLARQLADRNAALFDQSYQDTRSGTVVARWWLVTLGGLLLASLVGLQIVLRVMMHRRVNPAVAVATLLAGWLLVSGTVLLAGGAEQLRGAKEDAFDSLMALRQARAVSYDAKADESRYLLDNWQADDYEQAFLDKSEQLAGVDVATMSDYVTELNGDVGVYLANSRDVRFTGLLGVALSNITFDGEQEAANETLAAYQNYQRDDRLLRAKVADGDLRGAIEFCVRTTDGTSNQSFYRYDGALITLININQRAFDAHITAGESAVGGWTGLFPYGAAVLIVLLVAVGVWPRLAEYR